MNVAFLSPSGFIRSSCYCFVQYVHDTKSSNVSIHTLFIIFIVFSYVRATRFVAVSSTVAMK